MSEILKKIRKLATELKAPPAGHEFYGNQYRDGKAPSESGSPDARSAMYSAAARRAKEIQAERLHGYASHYGSGLADDWGSKPSTQRDIETEFGSFVERHGASLKSPKDAELFASASADAIDQHVRAQRELSRNPDDKSFGERLLRQGKGYLENAVGYLREDHATEFRNSFNTVVRNIANLVENSWKRKD